MGRRRNKTYDSNGNLILECYYDDDMEYHGKYRSFNENGELIIKIDYVHGKENGEYLEVGRYDGSRTRRGIMKMVKNKSLWTVKKKMVTL